MNRFELSQQGVNQLLDILYAASEEEIASEAFAVKNDFAKWVADKFILEADQLAFLNGIPDDYQAKFGLDVSEALTNKVPITLTRFPRPGEGGEKYIVTRPSKWSLEVETSWR